MNPDLWHLSKKKSEKGRVYVLTYILIHFAVQQKPTQLANQLCSNKPPPKKKKETCGLTTGSQTPDNLATGCYKPVRSGSDTLPQFFSGN